MSWVAVDGSGVLVNLVSNPSFEVSTSGWSANGAGTTVSRVTTDAMFGSACGKITGATGGTCRTIIQVDSNPGAGKHYAGSVYVKAGDATAVGKTCQCLVWDAAGTAVIAVATVTLTTSWQRITCTGVTAATATGAIQFYVGIGSGAASSNIVLIDGAQAEYATAATAYCDGDQTGCQWDSTAHASQSWRGLTLPLLSVEADVTNDPTNPTRAWTDITTTIRRIQTTRSGRNDELQRTVPGNLDILADNRNDTISSLGIGKAQWIRIRSKWQGVIYPRWQGIFESLPRRWPSAGKDATIEIEAADILKIIRLYDLADETFTAQRNDQRVAAIAALAGLTTGTIDTDTDDADAVTDPITAGTDALSTCLDIEQSENGLLIAEPDGTLTFQGRHWRLRNSGTSLATFGETTGQIPYRDTVTYEDDDTRIANVVAVTPLGGTASVVEDTTSKSRYWTRRMDRSLVSSDTSLATSAAQYLLNRYKDPSPRIPQIEVQLRAVTDPDLVASLLTAGNSSRFTWQRDAATTITEDVYVEQISETIVPGQSWDITFQLSPASDDAGWVLGDTTFSRLGVTTRLVY